MKWYQSTAFRIALAFVAGMLLLFSLLGLALTKQGERSFRASVSSIQVIPRRDQAGVVIIEQAPSLLDQQVEDASGKRRTPGEYFADQFRRSLLWVFLVGVGIALLLGVLITEYFWVKPLGRLTQAIRSLRSKREVTELTPTGLGEFDEVAKSFNELSSELARVETLRKDLISDTSHELKTPLASLQAQLEGMRDGLIPVSTEKVQELLKHVGRLTALTETLQEYARMRNRAATINRSDVHLRELFEHILAAHRAEVEVANLKVTNSISRTTTAYVDPALFEQVITNLLLNACAYAAGSTLRCSQKNDSIIIADTGKGVPKEALNHLFERFYRVDASRNRKHGGLGLGLAIVKEIVDAHAGRIEVTANRPQGLVFTITLPGAIAQVPVSPVASPRRERGRKRDEAGRPSSSSKAS